VGIFGFLFWGSCDLVAGVGGVSWFYSKKYSLLCSKGGRAWRKML
jgi:hypothetical protein